MCSFPSGSKRRNPVNYIVAIDESLSKGQGSLFPYIPAEILHVLGSVHDIMTVNTMVSVLHFVNAVVVCVCVCVCVFCVCMCVCDSTDTHYDAERDLKRRRKEKEKKIEKFEDAAKKRKKKESELHNTRIIQIYIYVHVYVHGWCARQVMCIPC